LFLFILCVLNDTSHVWLIILSCSGNLLLEMTFSQFLRKQFGRKTAKYRTRDIRPVFLYETLYQKEPEFRMVCFLIVWHGPMDCHGIVVSYIELSFEQFHVPLRTFLSLKQIRLYCSMFWL
jgi:hypothetical protein